MELRSKVVKNSDLFAFIKRWCRYSAYLSCLRLRAKNQESSQRGNRPFADAIRRSRNKAIDNVMSYAPRTYCLSPAAVPSEAGDVQGSKRNAGGQARASGISWRSSTAIWSLSINLRLFRRLS